jgi:hypothetical protein
MPQLQTECLDLHLDLLQGIVFLISI